METKLKEKKFDAALLYAGVLLGFATNFFVNTLDRYFIKYGIWYDAITVFVAFFLFWFIDHQLTKTLGK